MKLRSSIVEFPRKETHSLNNGNALVQVRGSIDKLVFSDTSDKLHVIIEQYQHVVSAGAHKCKAGAYRCVCIYGYLIHAQGAAAA